MAIEKHLEVLEQFHKRVKNRTYRQEIIPEGLLLQMTGRNEQLEAKTPKEPLFSNKPQNVS